MQVGLEFLLGAAVQVLTLAVVDILAVDLALLAERTVDLCQQKKEIAISLLAHTRNMSFKILFSVFCKPFNVLALWYLVAYSTSPPLHSQKFKTSPGRQEGEED